MGTCRSSQNNKNNQNLTISLKKFLQSTDLKAIDNSASPNYSEILCSNTGSFFDKKNSVIQGGLWIAEKIMRNINHKTLNLNKYITSFTPKFKLGDKCDKMETDNFFKEQLGLNDQFLSCLKLNDYKEFIRYKDDCTYLTFTSYSNNLSLALNDIDEIIDNKNLSLEIKDNKNRDTFKNFNISRKSISMNKPLYILPLFRKDLKKIKSGAMRNSEKFRKKSSFHLDKFVKISSFLKNYGRNSHQQISNRSLNITPNLRNQPITDENNFSVNNTGNSRKNSTSKQMIKDTISTERNRRTFIKGKNEEFDKISEKNESMTILKTNKKLSCKQEKMPKIKAKNKIKEKKKVNNPEVKRKKIFVKEQSKKTLPIVKRNNIISNLKVQDYNLPNIEFSTPKNFFLSSELKKGVEPNNYKSNESKNIKINNFNLNSNDNMNKNGRISSSQDDELALFSIKPLGERIDNQEAEKKDLYDNDDIVNYQHFLKSVAIQKSINKDYHYIKIDLRKLEKENIHLNHIINKQSKDNSAIKKIKTHTIQKNHPKMDNNTEYSSNSEKFLKSIIKPVTTQNYKKEINIYNINCNQFSSNNLDVKTRNTLKSFNSQSKLPSFPTNKLNLDPLKLDLPAFEKLKILKKQNKFLFELTEEERQATDELKMYLDKQYEEYKAGKEGLM